jgi:hypothetical protein
MKTALIGLMQSGKSTIISAITGKDASPIGNVNIEEVIVSVPDERINWLVDLYKPKKTVNAMIDCLDLPGLSFADESGRTAARRLFGQVRTVDMFVVVLNGYAADADPVKELADIRMEFLLADLELVMTRIERLEKQVNKPTKTQARDKEELAVQLKLQAGLEDEKPILSIIDNQKDLDAIKSLGFLTLKPILVVVNVSEDDLDKQYDFSSVIDDATTVIKLCATLESELAQLDDESRAEFMADLGLTEVAAARFVACCHATLGLISFLTVGPDEVRAWPLRKGTSALDAAGKIHSDIKRGFIRAETIAYDDLKEHGSEKECKAAGKTRLEGKTYTIQDGDIINFRFNV